MYLYLLIIMLMGCTSLAHIPAPLPEAVKQFQETVDLWHGLDIGHYLPGFHFHPIDAPSSQAWRDYLKVNGKNTLEEHWRALPSHSKRGGNFKTIQKLLEYANDPLAQKRISLQRSTGKVLAKQLIIDYADYLRHRPQDVLAYNAMRRQGLEDRFTFRRTWSAPRPRWPHIS
ncbi:uncharacterized protein UTRI_03313_B [Ustilago trichophora]|uniref:Uncharacterized protein n=1 Tax=Ustilago trichophora TaxID=86804 RepID=A0A5C3E7N4_9BASI|nr:uncharacterized protein UTRI_03313_B [Ustilago trichophora]